MADDPQVRLLKEGVAGWNAWREANIVLFPTLVDATLQHANLQGANLKNVILIGADLSGCDLSGANLENAYLEDAILEGANLSGALLDQTNLSRANLRGVNFWKAKLKETNFSGADLAGVDLSVDFSQAELRGGINFTGANLSSARLWEAALQGTNFSEANLSGAFLGGAQLWGAEFSRANLRGAFLDKSHLEGAKFCGADLTGVNLAGAHLRGTDLGGAVLVGANLEGTQLIEANIEGADLSKSRVYGISVWAVRGVPKDQSDLIITSDVDARVTVSDLEVAQFIYLLLKREKLRNVIDTITSKAVLILGRFTPERKIILDAMADELRKYNLLPIIFDFERSTERDFTETIKTLASLSLFVIADITNPKSAPLELQATVPDYQIPFVAIIEEGEAPFSMFSDLAGKYDWVLKPVIKYASLEILIRGFKQVVIDRAWAKHQELHQKKSEEVTALSIEEFLEKS